MGNNGGKATTTTKKNDSALLLQTEETLLLWESRVSVGSSSKSPQTARSFDCRHVSRPDISFPAQVLPDSDWSSWRDFSPRVSSAHLHRASWQVQPESKGVGLASCQETFFLFFFWNSVPGNTALGRLGLFQQYKYIYMRQWGEQNCWGNINRDGKS